MVVDLVVVDLVAEEQVVVAAEVGLVGVVLAAISVASSEAALVVGVVVEEQVVVDLVVEAVGVDLQQHALQELLSSQQTAMIDERIIASMLQCVQGKSLKVP